MPRIYINATCTLWTDVSDEDYEFLIRWQWSAHRDQRGHLYVRRMHYRSPVYMHRVIMRRVSKQPSDSHCLVDHLDGDGINNRRSNLRWATYAENAKNINRYPCEPYIWRWIQEGVFDPSTGLSTLQNEGITHAPRSVHLLGSRSHDGDNGSIPF